MLCVTHRLCTCGIELHHLYITSSHPCTQSICCCCFCSCVDMFSCVLLNETLFKITCLRLTMKGFLITLLHCAFPVVFIQCPTGMETACLVECGKVYCTTMFANGCTHMHVHNPVIRCCERVSGDFSQLREEGGGKLIDGVQTHFRKLYRVLLIYEKYCSVVMARMLKLLDAVPSSVTDFRCSHAQVVWCLSASVVCVVGFLKVL